jgi:hypothetical protein
MKLATVMGVTLGVRTTSMPPKLVWNRTTLELGQVVWAFSQPEKAASTTKNEKKRRLVLGKSNVTSVGQVVNLQRVGNPLWRRLPIGAQDTILMPHSFVPTP